jgi:rhodanese-related sulfurtransferase
MKIGYKQLIADAEKEIETLDLAAARTLHGSPDVVFVDLRDPRELTREGKIPGAFHAPRGMLEFWVDPESPYHKDVFSSGRKLIFYCQSGWRSALATQTVKRMGLDNVCHIGGGFSGWKSAGAPVEAVERH